MTMSKYGHAKEKIIEMGIVMLVVVVVIGILIVTGLNLEFLWTHTSGVHEIAIMIVLTLAGIVIVDIARRRFNA